jgi:hypothetical protein
MRKRFRCRVPEMRYSCLQGKHLHRVPSQYLLLTLKSRTAPQNRFQPLFSPADIDDYVEPVPTRQLHSTPPSTHRSRALAHPRPLPHRVSTEYRRQTASRGPKLSLRLPSNASHASALKSFGYAPRAVTPFGPKTRPMRGDGTGERDTVHTSAVSARASVKATKELNAAGAPAASLPRSSSTN